MSEKINNFAFVEHIFKKCHEDEKGYIDKGYRARLRKADNPDMESEAWEILNAWNVNITNKQESQIYALIASSIAKDNNKTNGNKKIGQAIAFCYEDGNKSDQAKANLRRLLACDTTDELCRVLRHILSLIRSNKDNIRIDYVSLLKDIVYFNKDKKAKWAKEFYNQKFDNNEEVQG